MQFAQLSMVKQRVLVGAPLPFNVRDADRSLLLARGQIVADHEQMEALFQRGALVDINELKAVATSVADTPRERLPALWRQTMGDVGRALSQPAAPGYAEALDAAATPVLALIERDPDLAIFQVLRQEDNSFVQYGLNHSLHTAIAAHMVAQRLRWSVDAQRTVFNAALTMNIAMLELQGQLAQQATPPTPTQRDAIRSHPQQSVAMLELAGVQDADWLATVAQHHEVGDGSGYPHGLTEVSELAALLRRADIYTAKLSGRTERDAMTADRAGRQMFMQDPSNPLTAALAKEFGVYPPGCHVALVSGETGIVVKRGASVTTPVVVALTNERGHGLSQLHIVDTADRAHAIVGVVPDRRVTVRVPVEKLLQFA